MYQPQVRWEEDEWDRLTDIVIGLRRKEPAESLIKLADRAQKQFPQNRQRKNLNTVAMLAPMIERIQVKDAELRAKAEKTEQLEARLTFFTNLPNNREELLNSLNHDEIRERYLPKLLELVTPDEIANLFRPEALLDDMPLPDLAAYILRRYLMEALSPKPAPMLSIPEAILQRLNGSTHEKTNGHATNGHRKRIVVIGTKGDQPRNLIAKVDSSIEVICYGVEEFRSIPKNTQHVFVWAKFVSHHHIAELKTKIAWKKVTEFFGGIAQLASAIEKQCGLVAA